MVAGLEYIHPMKSLGVDLLQHAPEILRLWGEAMAELPGEPSPEFDRYGLAEIIHALIEVSLLHPRDLVIHEQKVALAIAHGERIRRAGLPERVIYEEFAALREALRRYMEGCRTPRWKYREAAMRLDMASSVAELAVIRGYHRTLFEGVGIWETLTSKLARESPLLGLPEPI
jgi:hypothetical protein